MSGKILIFGATGGIGAASARALHAHGAALYLVGRKEAELAGRATETVATRSRRVHEQEGSF